MLFTKKESPVISIAKKLAVPALTILGSGVAAYVGASKGVADTVEAACKGAEKFIPTFEALINKAETAEATAPAAPAASDDEVAKYKEAIKKLMADNAALKNAAAQPAEAPKAEAPKAPEAKPAEAPKAEAPEAPKKEKKEKKDDAKAESQEK